MALGVFQFYNPGLKLDEMLGYDNPLLDAHDSNLMAYYSLKAPEKDFFTVPRELEMAFGGSVYPAFDKVVLKRHADRGVILIDKNAEDVEPDQPVAANEKEAKTKGDAKWQLYLRAKAQEWMDHIGQCKEQGLQPKPAQGFHKYALKALGIVDPAETVDNMLSTRAGDDEVSQLKARMVELEKMLKEKK